ncbi:hypothetical protein V6B33_03380 [Mangrovibacillus sp. Mu-81]|jgi:dimethylamine monooxygenase subunit C|uniref:hypothetical protein n=1 Tax=Mangrovibacillus sp. Mu-81 TaxID=3121478 RepID=UPI002FE4B56D
MGKSTPVFLPGKRKYLFCGDKEGMSYLEPVILAVKAQNGEFETGFVEIKKSPELEMWLRSQKMGSYLYVSVCWDRYKEIKALAESIGFTEEEAQFMGHGEKIVNIFCSRCHGMTRIRESESTLELKCTHCKLILVISDHYSLLRDAYLGYAAKR